jgi:hypothetical protein
MESCFDELKAKLYPSSIVSEKNCEKIDGACAVAKDWISGCAHVHP